jgi:5'-3' exonuclease
MSIALIDFSSLFHRLYHVDRVQVEQKIQSFLNSLPVYDEVIICLDSPPYKRKEIDTSYKANRDTPDPELIGSLRQCIKKVAESGYAIAGCDGWEADDVIATLVAKNTEESVTVYGTDKDLLQCCDLTVPFTNDVKTPDNTLGVPREKVVDYLCLVGDTSDNIKGVAGIGPKRAQDALAKFGSLSGMYETLKSTPSAFSDKTAEALLESLSWIDTTRQLITLNSKLDVKTEKKEQVETEYFETTAEPVETQFVQAENVVDVPSEITQCRHNRQFRRPQSRSISSRPKRWTIGTQSNPWA